MAVVILSIPLYFGVLIRTAFDIDDGLQLFTILVSSPILLLQAIFHLWDRESFLRVVKNATIVGGIVVVGSQFFFSHDYNKWRKSR